MLQILISYLCVFFGSNYLAQTFLLVFHLPNPGKLMQDMTDDIGIILIQFDSHQHHIVVLLRICDNAKHEPVNVTSKYYHDCKAL